MTINELIQAVAPGEPRFGEDPWNPWSYKRGAVTGADAVKQCEAEVASILSAGQKAALEEYRKNGDRAAAEMIIQEAQARAQIRAQQCERLLKEAEEAKEEQKRRQEEQRRRFEEANSMGSSAGGGKRWR